MTFLAIIMMVFAFAGMIKGMIGLGLPAVSMGLLTIAMSPFQAASLLIVPSMVTNVWQLLPKDMSGLLFAVSGHCSQVLWWAQYGVFYLP